MAARPPVSYPGVYIQEVDSGVRTIVGVGTSIGLFIGRTGQGPLNQPLRCLNYTDFVRSFSEDVSVGDLARYVRLFFENGGTDCYVMRIASRARAASVTLRNENEGDVLRLVAKQPGLWGDSIRVEVTYRGVHPEANFNMRLFRWGLDSRDRSVEEDVEEWRNLSMDPNSSNYAVDVLTQQSRLVNANYVGTGGPIAGYSLSGRPIEYADPGDSGTAAGNFLNAWQGLVTEECRQFEISVDGSGYALVDLWGLEIPSSPGDLDHEMGNLQNQIASRIRDRLAMVGAAGTTVQVEFAPGPTPGTGHASGLLRIGSGADGNVFIRRARAFDLAAPLMLGTEQGGLEVGAHALLRPAPNGISISVVDPESGNPMLAALAGEAQQENFGLTLAEESWPSGGINLVTTVSGAPLYREEATTPSPTGNNDGVREKLRIIQSAINNNSTALQLRAELWGHRLVLLPTQGTDNYTQTLSIPDWTGGTPSVSVMQNVRRYTLGDRGIGSFQEPGDTGDDGGPPGTGDYDNACEIVEREVDLFNLLILPPDRDPGLNMADLWPAASTFCERQRAFLLMDPPDSWSNAQNASEGIGDLRVGLVNDHSAVFFPKISINDGGRTVNIGASGAIAGLMARIDSSRGVWKAPAGIEANLRGVTGVQYRFSDRENGILNPRGINTIRIFPNGIVNWGARTMDGDDDFPGDWKYIPIRRLALFIEESLYRGLKWVVFEPNDEPLWAQIRLNVGAFMQDLFRQGAFQGRKPSDAYFVKCDAETTTQNDRNLGIVNVWVGFAPLKPAEFVILYLQQMAGQIQV